MIKKALHRYKIFLILPLVLAAALAAGCKGAPEESTQPVFDRVQDNLNSASFSCAVYIDGSLAYCVPGDGLYTTDGIDSALLHKGSFSDLHAVDDRLYFCDAAAGYAIFSCGKDGGELSRVTEERCWWVYYSEEYIYYLTPDESGGGRIMRRAHSTADSTLIATGASQMFLYGDTVLYCDDPMGDTPSVYSVSASGGTPKKLAEVSAQCLIAANGAIYYTDYWDGRLYRMGMDGTDIKLLSERCCNGLNYYNGELFYSDSADCTLYAYDTDSGTERRVCGECGGNVSIVGGELYFFSTGTSKLMRCTPGGECLPFGTR